MKSSSKEDIKKRLTGNPVESLLLFFGLITTVLWFSLNIKDFHFKDKAGVWVLWFTALVIIYYTIETRRLRVVSSKQLEAQQNTSKNEFLPLLVPVEGKTIIQEGRLKLPVINEGKGLARKVEVWVHGITVLEGVTVAADGNEHVLERYHENIDLILKNEKPKEMSAEIIYWDIYDRRCRTRGLKFYLDENDPKTRYLLDSTQWLYRLEE